ncbi:putative cog4 transporter [Erysiphe necator]|uniref:Conserved oligomeric Golgi complex subunit 4 n=1 Tax=Uncinula necator TaxID=52586 RepID=A0A0B1PC84_UNCNE|nr:putative cog4 transporter [Erysiphe necator]
MSPSPNGLHETASQVEPSAAPHSIYESSSVAEIRNSLSALFAREAAITPQIQTIVDSKTELSRELGRLDLLRANLSAQVIHLRDINNGKLEGAAETSRQLSSKIRELDLEKSRVEETLKVVEQVVELKTCVKGIVGSMGALQDWEAAANYISRASKIPNEIVNGEFASRIIPSAEVPETPRCAIENAKDSLCGLFLREFEKAVKEGDGNKITRFFKLFPLIKKEEIGLQVYGKYVCQGVATRARESLKDNVKNNDMLYYANILTRLFEHIAQIIEGHGVLVERHYGQRMMIKVIERLQLEADVQGGIILDAWGEKRNIERKLIDVKSYPFLFLLQSFLPSRKNLGVPRSSSPASGGGNNNSALENEGSVDLKEVDGILSEMAMMLGRWSLYLRFVASKLKDQNSNTEEPLMIPELLNKSTLMEKISTRLIASFNAMTTFFFRRSVEKAFQLDEPPSGLSLDVSKSLDCNPPFIISAVDDVMYIVSTVLQRSLTTSQIDVISSVVPTIGRVLGSDFIGMIQRKMRDESYPKPIIQGGLPPEEKVVAFIVLINSLEVANDYVNRIIISRLKPSDTTVQNNSIKEFFPFNDDFKIVTNMLENLNAAFASKVTELHSDGLHVMFNQVIKPRFRPTLTDAFRDTDYQLTEDELAEIAHEEGTDLSSIQELVINSFEHNWEAIMKPIQRIMNHKSFIQLLEQTADYFARILEKRIWSYAGKMNTYGAQRMEKDFSGIIRVVTKGNRYGVRSSFSRVSQICMLANMEEEEWEAINNLSELVDPDGGEVEDKMVWVLSENERQKARNLVKA